MACQCQHGFGLSFYKVKVFFFYFRLPARVFMDFIYDNKKYVEKTAVKIVRAIENDTNEYPNKGESIRDFLIW